MDLKELEISLINQTCVSCDNVPENLSQLVKWFSKGQYGAVVKSDSGQKILRTCVDENEQRLDMILKQNIDIYLDDTEEQNLPLRELELLVVATACLQLFVQNNWLGPSPSDTTPKDVLPECLTAQEHRLKHFIEAELSIDGEPVYNLAVHLEYLYLARRLLAECGERCKHLQTADWWAMRCTCVLQQILDDKSNTLRETAIHLIDQVSKGEPLMTDDANRDLQLEFHLEASHLCHMYYSYSDARDHINTAHKLSALKVELTGAMGKRTRFQQEDKAQLVLQVTRETGAGDGHHSNSQDVQVVADKEMPKNLRLEDDTVLDTISFSDGECVHSDHLSPTEQALVLGIMEDFRRSRASEDKLTEEEVQAHLTFVLEQVCSWSVSVSALLLRSKLEKGSRRRVERAMMQLEELYKQTKQEAPSAGQRLRHFYCVHMVPVWDIQKQLAEILMSLGAVGAALDIYERLEMWEDAIACYQRMGKVEKAETVIREQLAVKETPNLWCFLGDVTRNIEYYEKGWELSNHRSARAQRCMGYLYFGREEYQKSLECFDKSLKVNALQVPVWFTYGCAAMAAEDFTLAVKAFKRCTSIDYDNFEAWTNLATAYIRLKEKKKAFRTLNDAIKCNYENWKIWENYLLVSTDCGEFGQVIRAYHRLIDLREKWVDEQVLEVLVKAVRENLMDADKRPATLVKPQLKELFGRITAKVTDSAAIWRLYAQLSMGEDADKALQFLQKAHRSTMQTANWERKLDTCQEVTNNSIELAESYLSASESAANSTQAIQMLSSAKLMLRGVLSKIKQHHTDPVTQQLAADSVVQMCADMDAKMATIMEKINALKAT